MTRRISWKTLLRRSPLGLRRVALDSKPALLPLDICPLAITPPQRPVPAACPTGCAAARPVHDCHSIVARRPAIPSGRRPEHTGRGGVVGATADVRVRSSCRLIQGAADDLVAVVAYDRSGNVVGWRRWKAATACLRLHRPFDLMLSSVAAGIDHVEFAVQAGLKIRRWSRRKRPHHPGSSAKLSSRILASFARLPASASVTPVSQRPVV